ncbi:flagellar motor stator protein MotA [Sphingomonas sp. Leaf231]|uniref:flagellar motor stator protein MotA n=1 Tax=Sphingomonas sp. Leaf231 TaxID=1736301 RepID=UPI000700BDF2|nr:flagellar motor stator protein MotA [Sphingomonas sp. Leaf231]KQN90038.1 flagellar motor stator protein MotA [Sphingomonas sp. Leaf231]
MINGIAVVLILACVFGSFVISGGNIAVILHALPHELVAIVGAATGAFMLGNGTGIIRRAWQGLQLAFRGPHWREMEYRDLLALLYALLTLFRKEGPAAIENHIDAPDQSSIFISFPRLLEDRELMHFICDYLRMMTVSLDDPHQLAEAMESDIERHHAEQHQPVHALHTMADGLPALGIVAAVLGVIKTMSSIDQPTQILGEMIGGALVGTFLGVLLSYCFVGPIASKLSQIVEADTKPYTIAKATIIAYAEGTPVQIAIELARRMTPSHYAPSFSELEESLQPLRVAA